MTAAAGERPPARPLKHSWRFYPEATEAQKRTREWTEAFERRQKK